MAELPKDIHPTVQFGFFVGLQPRRGRRVRSSQGLTRVKEGEFIYYLIPKIHILLSAWLLSVTLLLVSPIAAVGCNSSFCEEFNICITGGLMSERDAVCAAAQNAHDFFRPLDLDFPSQLTITFKQQIQPCEDFVSIGCYHPENNSIFVLDYRSAVAASHRAPPAFGIPMSISLWRSYLVHEIAHAIVERHFMADNHTLAPTEYIAAAAQLSTLPADVLAHILSNYRNVSAFRDESEITDLFYFMKPCEFAVKAYLHYLRPANGQKFIRRLLLKGLPDSGVRGNIPFF